MPDEEKSLTEQAGHYANEGFKLLVFDYEQVYNDPWSFSSAIEIAGIIPVGKIFKGIKVLAKGAEALKVAEKGLEAAKDLEKAGEIAKDAGKLGEEIKDAEKVSETSKIGKAKVECPTSKMTNAQKGVFGEAKADEKMLQDGYKKLNGEPVKIGDKPQGQGIDGVWKNSSPPPDYVITEAKYGTSQLRNTKKDGKQMSDKWIDKRLDKSVGKPEAENIRNAIQEGRVEKWKLNIDEAGNVSKTSIE